MLSQFLNLSALPSQDDAEFQAQHDAYLVQLLPWLGPAFGMGVLLFSVWDYLIDPAHAVLTMFFRAVCVLAGAPAYLPLTLRWKPNWRFAYLFLTHAGAILVAEYLLTGGMLYGLAGVTSCVLAVSVIAIRFSSLAMMLAPTSVLFLVLSGLTLTQKQFLNNLMLYVFSVLLTILIMLTVRRSRHQAFLLEKKLLHASRHDSLTGACNRGYLVDLGEREVTLAKRYGRPLALIMIDIDHFKQVNDTYGHEVGDRVIKTLVEVCQSNLRSIDHFGRIGGEEFVCILPETEHAEAWACAERMRKSVEAVRMDTRRGSLHFTVSMGIAVLTPSDQDLTSLLRGADDALYRAKRDGRNRVTLMRLPS